MELLLTTATFLTRTKKGPSKSIHNCRSNFWKSNNNRNSLITTYVFQYFAFSGFKFSYEIQQGESGKRTLIFPHAHTVSIDKAKAFVDDNRHVLFRQLLVVNMGTVVVCGQFYHVPPALERDVKSLRQCTKMYICLTINNNYKFLLNTIIIQLMLVHTALKLCQ